MRKYKIEFTLCIRINSTCVKEVKRKEKSLKLLEENILQYPQDIKIKNDLLDKIQKIQNINEKNDDFNKIQVKLAHQRKSKAMVVFTKEKTLCSQQFLSQIQALSIRCQGQDSNAYV